MFVYFAEVDTSNVVERIVTLDSKDIIDDEDDTVSEDLGLEMCTKLYGDIESARVRHGRRTALFIQAIEDLYPWTG